MWERVDEELLTVTLGSSAIFSSLASLHGLYSKYIYSMGVDNTRHDEMRAKLVPIL